MLVEIIKFCTRSRHVVTAGLSAALKARGWNCLGFRCGVSVWSGAVLLVTWSYIESEVSHEILNKTNFIVSVKSKGNKSELKFRIRDFKLKLFVTHFPLWNSSKCYCNFGPSMSVGLPQRHRANYKPLTTPPRITQRGWVLYLHVKSKPAWTRPLTHTTHRHDAHIRFNTDLKINCPLHALILIRSTILCSNYGKQKGDMPTELTHCGMHMNVHLNPHIEEPLTCRPAFHSSIFSSQIWTACTHSIMSISCIVVGWRPGRTS